MHSALAVANHFIQTALDHQLANRDFTPAKVHGLVYLANGWLLGSAGASIIKGHVMAHRDGVFIPELREAGCWGTKNVTQLVSKIELDEKRGIMVEHTPHLIGKNPTVPALDWVWKTYGNLPSFQIVQHTKEPGSPWDLIWNDEERVNDEPLVIPSATMKMWFRGLSGRRGEQARHSKLTATQRCELKPRKPSLDKTQQLLAQPDPNRLRSA